MFKVFFLLSSNVKMSHIGPFIVIFKSANGSWKPYGLYTCGWIDAVQPLFCRSPSYCASTALCRGRITAYKNPTLQHRVRFGALRQKSAVTKRDVDSDRTQKICLRRAWSFFTAAFNVNGDGCLRRRWRPSFHVTCGTWHSQQQQQQKTDEVKMSRVKSWTNILKNISSIDENSDYYYY